MKVRDIMTTSVETVDSSTTIQECARKMKELDIGSLPVCDGERIQGLVTDRDIVINVVARGEDPEKVTVADAMSSPVVYVFEDDEVGDAVRLMEVKQIRRLVVLDRDKMLAGFLALGDIAVKAGETLAGETLEQISESRHAQAV